MTDAIYTGGELSELGCPGELVYDECPTLFQIAIRPQHLRYSFPMCVVFRYDYYSVYLASVSCVGLQLASVTTRVQQYSTLPGPKLRQ